IIVTAPVLVLFYDRTFVSSSWREAWRRRWIYYLALAATWLVLARLMSGLHERGAGFNAGVTWWQYGLTSCRSLALYLKLSLWPHPLVLDYGPDLVWRGITVLPQALLLAALLVATARAVWCRAAPGFAGVWYFLVLAPATSVVPVAGQPMAEHRVYLSLAAVSFLAVAGLFRLPGKRAFILGA